MKKLDISPQLSLPLDAATETFGILAKKGSGKSNAAVVMAEQMWKNEIPWVAIDPKGDWWGLRSSQDGKHPGLALPVFGGRHGDIPLEPGKGKEMADLILDRLLTCVLDVSEFSKGEVEKFLVAFADRFYRQATDEPIHLFLEEAHEYLPQRVMAGEARLVGAWQKIVKQGRFKGIGCTLISQRSASLNKDVLTQVDTLITLRTTSPQDRAAIKAWVDIHAESHEMLDSLPLLADGEAWIWSPEFLKTLTKIRFHRRETFDSGATPKVGQAKRVPATLADVNLDAIREQMSETIEKAKASDPKVLQARIRELERELADQKPQVVEKIVEVEKLPEGLGDLVTRVEDLKAEVERHNNWSNDMVLSFGEILGDLSEMMEGRAVSTRVVTATKTVLPAPPPPKRPDVEVESAPNPVRRRLTPSDNGDVKVTGGALRMLNALRYMGQPLSKSQIAIHAGMKKTSGTFSNYLSILRTAGYIEDVAGKIQLTDAGYDFLGWDGKPVVPSSEQIRDIWRDKLTGGALRMFDTLVEAWPGFLVKQDLAEAVGMSVTSGTFSNYLSILRTNELIVTDGQQVVANAELF